MKFGARGVAAGMGTELGKVGIWRPEGVLDTELAVEVERLGYGTLWIGGSPPADLDLTERLLDATSTLVVATGIVNMWSADAGEVARSTRRIMARHPDRFLLGVGVGHPEANDVYERPYDKIVSYLDELDAAGVGWRDRVLAALGPRVLRLAGQRTAGAHPYLTTPVHTAGAREVLGSGPLLAPEHKVVLDSDPERARATARPVVGAYLGLRNYANNLLRLGYTQDDIDNGSDRLVDALALHGDADTIAAGLTAHLDSGADHVCVQVLDDDPLPGYRALAGAMSGSLA